ncbi:MAG: alanine racemase [Rhodospirillales bacterium]
MSSPADRHAIRPEIDEARAGAVLTIDLDAIAANYRLLAGRLGDAVAAAVVKADAYGLGAERVAPALAAAGCRTFFVATLDEGLRLRGILDDPGDAGHETSEIHVLNGIAAGPAADFEAGRLVPVLNGLGEITAWRDHCRARELALPCDVHVDTGMLRLGLPPDELRVLADEPARLDGLDIRNVLSHLASADEPECPKNAEQLQAFLDVRRVLPQGKASFANSSGIFLGPDYHFDMARPGVALYGGAPVPGESNPMAQVIILQGKIAQVRAVDTPQTVGYGATHRIEGPGRIATLAVGYADGYLRSLSNRGTGYIGDIPVPVVGRVSMDLITLDVSGVPEDSCPVGGLVDLIGPHNPVDRIAAEAGTIAYEVLTSLGNRYHRVYTGGGA